MNSTLNGKQKRHLRGLAHHLNPVVTIGKSGVTSGLIEQLNLSLEDHELIKVKLLESCPQDKTECAQQVQSQTQASLVQSIGRVLVLYRARKEKPVIELP